MLKPADADPFDLEHLVDTLLDGCPIAYHRHLVDAAWHQHARANGMEPHYSFQEVKLMVEMLPTKNPMIADILNRDHGTVRFGRALRALTDSNNSAVVEIAEELERIRTCDELVRALARATQACLLAKPKSNFIIIPTEEDLGALLNDVDTFGARNIAGMIIILATLRYPSQSLQPNLASSQTSVTPTEEDSPNE